MKRERLLFVLQSVIDDISFTVDPGYDGENVLLGPMIDICVRSQQDLEKCRAALQDVAYESIYIPDSKVASRFDLPFTTLLGPPPTRLSQAQTVVTFLSTTLLLDPTQTRTVTEDMLASGILDHQWPLDFESVTWTIQWGELVEKACRQDPFPFPEPVLESMDAFKNDSTMTRTNSFTFIENFYQRRELISIPVVYSKNAGCILMAFREEPSCWTRGLIPTQAIESWSLGSARPFGPPRWWLPPGSPHILITPGVPSRAQVHTCIIFVRSSTEAQAEPGLSVERQYITLLSKMKEVVELTGLGKVIVAVEYCSSNQQPWMARRLVPSILESEPSAAVLTVNPDRLTRRSSGLRDIMDAIRPCSRWYTLGMPESRNDGTEIMNGTIAELRRVLEQTREIAIQHGVYSRAVGMMSRMLAKEYKESHAAILELQGLLASIAHRFQFVLIWTRTSPSFRDGKTSLTNLSIERQRTFLETMLGSIDKERCVNVDMEDTSAFGCQAMDTVEKIVRKTPGTVLILTTMVDRLVRHEEHLPRLQERNVQIISLLWDPQQFDLTHGSRECQEWLKKFPASSTNALSAKTLAPDMWYDKANNNWNHNVLAHIAKAQAFYEARQPTFTQGTADIETPPQLVRVGSSRGFNEDRAIEWKLYTKSQVPESMTSTVFVLARIVSLVAQRVAPASVRAHVFVIHSAAVLAQGTTRYRLQPTYHYRRPHHQQRQRSQQHMNRNRHSHLLADCLIWTDNVLTADVATRHRKMGREALAVSLATREA
ncbi:MAG: hypothetical protein J3R72DRAFT_498070 [Linnemannia gamsii]|nr:MAG: hypothetical protein J3R72DRAFT_498070 [Linnemannia gamsii]